MHPVGFEPTIGVTCRIMSPVQSTTLPWMQKKKYSKKFFFIYNNTKKIPF